MLIPHPSLRSPVIAETRFFTGVPSGGCAIIGNPALHGRLWDTTRELL